MDSQVDLDPGVVLDQDIQAIEEQIRDAQHDIDTRLREWISWRLTEMALKRMGLKRKTDERKQATQQQLESLTQVRNLGQKKSDLERRRLGLVELKQSLSDPDLVQEIDAMGHQAVELSLHPDRKLE